jgi:hypothetical protein
MWVDIRSGYRDYVLTVFDVYQGGYCLLTLEVRLVTKHWHLCVSWPKVERSFESWSTIGQKLRSTPHQRCRLPFPSWQSKGYAHSLHYVRRWVGFRSLHCTDTTFFYDVRTQSGCHYIKKIDSSLVNENIINRSACGLANSSIKIENVCQFIWLQ